jgi:hypothetical protein
MIQHCMQETTAGKTFVEIVSAPARFTEKLFHSNPTAFKIWAALAALFALAAVTLTKTWAYRIRNGGAHPSAAQMRWHSRLDVGLVTRVKGFVIRILSALLKRLGVDWAADRQTLGRREAEVLLLRQAAETQTDELLGARAVRSWLVYLAARHCASTLDLNFADMQAIRCTVP